MTGHLNTFKSYRFVNDYDSLVNPIPFLVGINDSYEIIAEKFQDPSDSGSNKIAKSFFKMVPYISRICWEMFARSSGDLVDLLTKSRCPEVEIRILDDEFDQAAFDKISRLTSITSLSIDQLNVSSSELNFNFLSNMISLRSLRLNISLKKWPIHAIREILKKCRFFSHLNIQRYYLDTDTCVSAYFQPYTKKTRCLMVGRQVLSERSGEEVIQYLRESEVTKQFCN